jgi:dihydroorotate dehydrogenase electron transfer subunit
MQESNPSAALEGVVRGNRKLSPGHYLLTVKLPESFSEPVPGQFVMLRSGGSNATFLSRPFSVHGFQKGRNGTKLELFYRVSGQGTLRLSYLNAGAEVKVLGPLGNGFPSVLGAGKIILIAGGVGIAPLAFFLQRQLKNRKSPTSFDVFLGARDAGTLKGMESRIPAGAAETYVATDDGSAGHHGPVTDILIQELPKWDQERTTVLACGPSAMMRSLALILKEEPVVCMVSLEERMACGIGACLGCVVPTRDKNGRIVYKRVCKDGPVFDIREIIWNP